MTAPAARVRGRYQTKPGGKHDAPSVTTILGVLNKPGLPWGAAKETALFAVHHKDEWMHLDTAEAVERLRKHHRGVWDDKAARGTRVHDIACRWAAGEECDVDDECEPYVDALERFYVDHKPKWVEVEQTIIYDDKLNGYGGTFDAVCTLDCLGGTILVDIKTGADVYPDTALQLAAYRFAHHIGVYDDDGKLADVRPMIPVAGCAVLHLQGDGTYRIVPTRSGAEQHTTFIMLRRAWEWVRTAEKEALGAPIVGGVREEVPA